MKNVTIAGVVGVIAIIALVVAVVAALQNRNDQDNNTEGVITSSPSPTSTGRVDTDNVPTVRTQYTVNIEGQAFSPATLTITQGDTVFWVNNDQVSHQVISDPHPGHSDLPSLDSSTIEPGGSYSFTFTEAGTYGYHCDIHLNMEGTVVVE